MFLLYLTPDYDNSLVEIFLNASSLVTNACTLLVLTVFLNA